MLEQDNNDMILGDPQNVSSPQDISLDLNKEDSFDGEEEDGGELDMNGEPKNAKRRKVNTKGGGPSTRSRTQQQRGGSAAGARQEGGAERQLQELISSLTKQISNDKPAKKDEKQGSTATKTSGMEGLPEGAYAYNNMPMTTVSTQPRPMSSTPPYYPNSMEMSAPTSQNQQPQMQGQYSMGAAWQEGALSLSSTVTTYLDAYSRYIARHISVHPGVFEPGSALRILGNPNEQRTPLAFQTFAVLANGARVTGHVPASNDFATRARRTLGAVFDQTDSLVAQGLMILSYYMSGEAEADKTMYYLQLARKMCQHLKTRTSDYYMLILMTIGFASPHPEEKLEVFSELKQRLGPLLSSSLDNVSRNFTLTLAIISVQLELELAKLRSEYNADYPVMLQVLERLEKMLTSDKCTSYSKLGFRIFLEVIRAQCYCNLGLREMAVECTNAVSELCKDPEFQYVPIGVLGGVAMMATIQLQENRLELVREHISRMTKMSNTYPFVRLIAKKLSEALQDKVNKAYERIQHERNLDTGVIKDGSGGMPTGVSSSGGTPMATGVSPTSPSYPPDHSSGHSMPPQAPQQVGGQSMASLGYSAEPDYRSAAQSHGMYPPEPDMRSASRMGGAGMSGMSPQVPMQDHPSYMKSMDSHSMSPYDQHAMQMDHGMGMGGGMMAHRGMHTEQQEQYMGDRRMAERSMPPPQDQRGYGMHGMHHPSQAPPPSMPQHHAQAQHDQHDMYGRPTERGPKLWPDRRSAMQEHTSMPHQPSPMQSQYMPPQPSHSFAQMMQPGGSGQFPPGPSMTRTGLQRPPPPPQMQGQGMYNMPPYGGSPQYMPPQQQQQPPGPGPQQGFGISRSAMGGSGMMGAYNGDELLDLHNMRYPDQSG